ncbi:MAG: hypothetical protein IIV43_09460, partial [Oscillospiraceae bacterium]|nr:hypothetical protein [Oscillospiraceae bacterium]
MSPHPYFAAQNPPSPQGEGFGFAKKEKATDFSMAFSRIMKLSSRRIEDAVLTVRTPTCYRTSSEAQKCQGATGIMSCTGYERPMLHHAAHAAACWHWSFFFFWIIG